MSSQTPSTMRVWKYASADGGIEQHLQLHQSQPIPKPSPNDHLIQVLAVGLNPVDYKPAESFAGGLLVKKPASPGFDIAGRIVAPAAGSKLQRDDLVFGASSTNPMAGGALAEYIITPAKQVVPLPPAMTPQQGAGVAIACVTAHDSLVSYIQGGSRVFINGGSGGTGTYGIQIAKALGAHVTVSCSSRNVALCRELGADQVLDYTASPLLGQLRAQKPFDHVIDNVFSDPGLYFQAHTYTNPKAKYALVAASPNLAFFGFALRAFFLPGFLGGGRRKIALVMGDIKQETLEKSSKWFVEGKVRTVVDSVFPMEDVVDAYKRLKTGRAAGKILVNVANEKVQRID